MDNISLSGANPVSTRDKLARFALRPASGVPGDAAAGDFRNG
jgi:hypothetical protein